MWTTEWLGLGKPVQPTQTLENSGISLETGQKGHLPIQDFKAYYFKALKFWDTCKGVGLKCLGMEWKSEAEFSQQKSKTRQETDT